MSTSDAFSEFKVRNSAYNVHVGYVQEDGRFRVVGYGMEKNRPALLPRSTFEPSGDILGLEAPSKSELVSKVKEVV